MVANTRGNMSTLTILIGLPRSGKSTWIKQNAGNAVVVSNDWIRENILGTHYSNLTDAVLRVVLGQGKDAILDGVNHTKAVRSFYVKLAREYGAKIHMVIIGTPLEVCLKRNIDKKLPDAKLIEMMNGMENPDSDEYDTVECVFDINT